MEFRILGPVEILDDHGERLVLRGSRERTVLALLLLSPNRVVAPAHFADVLWDGRPPDSAPHALQVYVSRLRKALHASGASHLLVRQPSGYLLDIDESAVDAGSFESLAAEARRQAGSGDHGAAAVTLRKALELWRGPALAGVADSRIMMAEAARLEERRLSALEDRIDNDLACGRQVDLVAELETLTTAHPLRERLWGQRMTALYRAGRQAESLRVFQDLRTVLREELGLEPSIALQRLEGAILRHELDKGRTDAARTGPGRVGETVGAAAGPFPLPMLLTEMRGAFVGRERELQTLEALWTDARAGAPRCAFLSGEPGAGKTRLAAEMAGRVHRDGAIVVAGRCDEDLAAPYQPFVEAFDHFVEHAPFPLTDADLGPQAGELSRIRPDLLERFPQLPPPLRSEPNTERYRFFEAVAGWLAATSHHRPVLFALDDLQWATTPTLLLLRHVVRHARSRRVLILAVFRDTDLGPGHPLESLLADFRRQPGVARLALSGLPVTEVARFVSQTAGQPFDDGGLSLAKMIHTQTAGNPFFMREVVHHLVETGLQDHGSGHGASPGELGVPPGAREMVERRLSRLGRDANRVLRVAAVMGTEFDLQVVGGACGLDEEALVGAVEEAIGAHLLVDSGSPAASLRFAHALVRDTLYEGLSAARRAVLHRQVAESIEAMHSVTDDRLPTLAHHWSHAPPTAETTARAIHYITRAGDRALALLAHDEAAGHYASGLGLLEETGAAETDRRRLELLIAGGEAQRRSGDPGYRETLLTAARLARRLGDTAALAQAALANTRGHIYSAAMEVDADRVEMLEAALAGCGGDVSSARARLTANLGLELAWQPDPQRRLMLSAEALRLARRLDDPETLAHVLVARDYTISAPENAEERLAATTEILAIADQTGDPVLASRALTLRFKAAMELADVAEAERSLGRNRAVVVDAGQPALTWATRHQDATLRVLHCDPDAEAAIEAAHQFGVQTGQADIAVFSAAHRLSLYLDQGRLAELEEFARHVAEATRYPMVQGLYASILAETGQLDSAARVYDALAATGFAHPTHNVAWLRFAADCAWLCARLRREDCVPTLQSRLEPYADQLVVISLAGGVTGSVAFYLGLLASTVRQWQKADAYFMSAAATHERIGAPSWLARTRLEWARMLLARHEPGDRGRADELLRQALATASAFGLSNLERDSALLLGSGSD